MKKEIIVITGGPGSGKTSIINLLEKEKLVCYPEISREITLEAQEKGIEQLFLTEPLLFSQMLLEGRLKQFYNAQLEKDNIVFLDRGVHDVIAYMDFIGDTYPNHFIEACQKCEYTKVFLLPPWKEIYKSDEARYETFEQAEVIYENLKQTYLKFGYQLYEVPKETVENRMNFILKNK